MKHVFICDNCGIGVQDTSTKDVHACPKCGKGMRWDLAGGGVHRGDYNHTSDSLAVHPDDIPEHRRLFPNVDITPEGQPHFTSTKQQERYAERCGFYKKEGRHKKRPLGSIRIA